MAANLTSLVSLQLALVLDNRGLFGTTKAHFVVLKCRDLCYLPLSLHVFPHFEATRVTNNIVQTRARETRGRNRRHTPPKTAQHSRRRTRRFATRLPDHGQYEATQRQRPGNQAVYILRTQNNRPIQRHYRPTGPTQKWASSTTRTRARTSAANQQIAQSSTTVTKMETKIAVRMT